MFRVLLMPRPSTFFGSPAAAYRVDMAGRSAPFGADEQWLTVANALHLATTSEPRQRKQRLFAAVSEAMDVVPEEQVEAFAKRENLGEQTIVDAIVVLVRTIQEAGAFRLAACMTDDVLAAAEHSELQRGRLLALRARIEWKLGNLEDAHDRYQYIEDLGKKRELPELQARAHVGLSSLAQQRGNLPALRMHSAEAVRLAESIEHFALARLGWQGLTMAATKDGDHGAALEAGWRVIALSRGDATLEAEGLQNLGQLMLEAGHWGVARSCFSAVLAKPAPARLLVYALGGLALASGRLKNEATVEWSMREVWRARDLAVAPYAVGVALLECATALTLLARREDAVRFRDAAVGVATKGGFHELEHRARELDVDTAPDRLVASPLPESASLITDALEKMEPAKLPAHVELTRAPA